MTTEKQELTPGGVALERLVSLARECPKDYNEAGPSFAAFERNENIQALSAALREAGYEMLARAVPQGVGWSRRIAWTKHEYEMKWHEEEAARPGWSWNSEVSRPNSTAALEKAK